MPFVLQCQLGDYERQIYNGSHTIWVMMEKSFSEKLFSEKQTNNDYDAILCKAWACFNKVFHSHFQSSVKICYDDSIPGCWIITNYAHATAV